MDICYNCNNKDMLKTNNHVKWLTPFKKNRRSNLMLDQKMKKKLPLNIFESSIMVVTIENFHDLNKVASDAKILVMKFEKFDQG
jgi:hypothetical protein